MSLIFNDILNLLVSELRFALNLIGFFIDSTRILPLFDAFSPTVIILIPKFKKILFPIDTELLYVFFLTINFFGPIFYSWNFRLFFHWIWRCQRNSIKIWMFGNLVICICPPPGTGTIDYEYGRSNTQKIHVSKNSIENHWSLNKLHSFWFYFAKIYNNLN